MDNSATVYSEGAAFLARHPELDRVGADWGALTWGFMRALYESPCHPGSFMVPVPETECYQLPQEGDWWYCTVCQVAYEYRTEGKADQVGPVVRDIAELWTLIPGVRPRVGVVDMGTGPFAAFAVMDDRGFLPPCDCMRCGKPLEGMGQGHPAERYTGTYTGLCYACNDRPPECMGVSALDGAQYWEYPPHSPSWRRYREGGYVGYADCARCDGRGVTNWPVSYGTAYKSCDDCHARYDAHPLRQRYEAGTRQIYKLANERFTAAIWRLAGVNEHTPRKLREGACGKVARADVDRLSAESWTWYQDQLHKLQDKARERGVLRVLPPA